MQKAKTVIYIDDNADHRELLKFLFEDAGYNILTCSMLKECFQHLSENEISAVVMDYWLEGSETLEAGEKIKEMYPKIPLFYFTGDAQAKSREKALKVGAQGFLLKPNDVINVVPTVSLFLN